MSVSLDVLGIGNAIVDTISRAEDDVLVHAGLVKGSMALVDEVRADQLYELMGPTTVISGGSAANTMAGIASLGATAGFVGKVKADAAGKEFTHDIRKAGVAFDTPAATDGAGDRPLPDLRDARRPAHHEHLSGRLSGAGARRTSTTPPSRARRFSTWKAICGTRRAPRRPFCAPPRSRRANGRKVALTLSDAFCVGRYRDEFLSLIRDRRGRHSLRQ